MTTTLAPSTTVWKLDPSHSNVAFSAKHMVITTVKGRFANVEGAILIDGETPESATVNVTMKADSIDTGNAQRDEHLRSADFLDAATHPAITFQSTQIEGTNNEFALTGILSIRGKEQPITLDVTFEGAGNDPWGGERMGFSATGRIDRRDFGLVWNQLLETGGALVSNEIKIQIDAQLIKSS